MATKRTVIFEFKTTGENIADKLKTAGAEAGKLQDKMKTLGTSMSKMVTVPILGGATAAVKLASDMDETMNKVRVSFGDASKGVEDWAKTSIESMGLAQQTALDTAALFGDMGTGMGLNEKEAAGMATSLTQLSADLASFKNVSQDVAKTALAGVFTGETESLKQLGIVMTEANLQEYALAQGIKTKVSEMTQDEKVQLRYNYVMEKTQKAQGDFARTSDGMANQSRMLTERMKELGVQLGQVILPVALKLVTKIGNLVQKFNELSPSAKRFIVIAAGIAAAVGPVILIIMKAVQIFKAVRAIMLALTAAQWAWNASMLANPIFLIITAIVALIAIIILLVKNWDKVKEVAMAVWAKVKEVFNAMWSKVKSVVDKIKNAFLSVKDAIITAFKAVKEFFKNTFSAIANIVKAPINWIIDKINSFLKGINKIKIPKWVPVVGGKTMDFPMIPTLAKGGVVNSATQAVIGEGADPEAVVPLNQKSISKFVGGLNMSPSQSITVTIPQTQIAVVDLNNRVIGNMLLPGITRSLKIGGALT